MNIDRILGAAGVLIGLPGFIILFFSGHVEAAVWTVLIGLVLVIAAAVVYFMTSRPEYTMLSAEVTLTFTDASCRKATIKKEYSIRPNYSHSVQIIHRNIAADGTVENIQWNGEPVPQSNIRKIMGEYEVRIDFPGPRKRWREFKGALSYDTIDSFNKSSEGVHYVTDFPTKRAVVRVFCPPGKPCKSVGAWVIAGAERPLPDPKLLNNGHIIELAIKRPILPAEYAIKWEW